MVLTATANGAICTILLDSGATGSAFVSKKFCDLIGIVSKKSAVSHSIRLGNNSTTIATETAIMTRLNLAGIKPKLSV